MDRCWIFAIVVVQLIQWRTLLSASVGNREISIDLFYEDYYGKNSIKLPEATNSVSAVKLSNLDNKPLLKPVLDNRIEDKNDDKINDKIDDKLNVKIDNQGDHFLHSEEPVIVRSEEDIEAVSYRRGTR